MKKEDIYYLWPVKLIPDKIFVRLHYLISCKKILHLNHPKLFNEKIQWMKIYDRKEEYVKMVDKAEAKKYVGDIIGYKYIIPTLGVYNSFEEIDFDSLPNQFVMKPTHDSGGIVVVKDKAFMKLDEIKHKLNKSLKRNYFYMGREWPYKNAKPRIIVEPYMVDESGVELKDYKILCFRGEPKLVQIDSGRFTDFHIKNTYTTEWEFVPLAMHYETDPEFPLKKPVVLDEMLNIARKLAYGRSFIRVDFYVIKDKVYFGELTFMHDSGFAKIDPPEWNQIMGDWMGSYE